MTAKSKISKNQELKITAQRNMFEQVLMLFTENGLDLQNMMEFPLGPMPWALATSDGFPMKTNKAVLMHKLEDTSALKSQTTDKGHMHIYI
ncbi:hypothetical protein PoB_003294700 [Plakobranchus ocellatus]|uniref:Uncharacterized protein n=1 Tax=Plakobranchus ocellatus TaxID=259542 RepID=A0AAV4AGR4_9GAST|nr:hypothetical protein PoB_003294700 [Plakobranchus ocellatus]